MKKILISTVVIFIVWTAWDFLVHGILLQSYYEATASLWRPKDEMNHLAMSCVSLLSAFLFSYLYSLSSESRRLLSHGVLFGALVGSIMGLSMGFCLYIVMPISFSLATAWFLANFVAFSVAGAIASFVSRAA